MSSGWNNQTPREICQPILRVLANTLTLRVDIFNPTAICSVVNNDDMA
jgi:hypothetical protein